MDRVYQTKTKLYRVDAQLPDKMIIDIAGEIIGRGGLVAFPTETVYGLGANALDDSAVAKIFCAKGRPANDPLIVHIAELDQLRQVASEVPNIALELIQSFTPGPLTLVLEKGRAIPALLTAGLDTVAVRIPDHAVALALIDSAGVPIAAPSANTFSRPSPTCAQHVLEDLRGRVDLVLDGGPTSIGVESTIVDLTRDPPQLLRPGGVPLESLRDLLPHIEYQPRYLPDDVAAAPAPGNLLRHYSPRAKVVLFRAEHDEDAIAAMRAYIEGKSGIGVIAMDANLDQFCGTGAEVESLGRDLDEAGNRLFAALRELDRRGVEEILAMLPQRRGLGLAISDRLLRAAAGRVIDVPRTK